MHACMHAAYSQALLVLLVLVLLLLLLLLQFW